jgi:uncharacterized protein YhfF
VTIKLLSEVDEAFAWDEGERDRTRDWWVAAHRRYFGRQASREGFDFDDDILTVFERGQSERFQQRALLDPGLRRGRLLPASR